jgi:hypothetical protein
MSPIPLPSLIRLALHELFWFIWYTYIVSVLIGFFLIVVGAGMFAWPFALAKFWQPLSEAMVSPWLRIFTTAIFVSIAFILYLARTHMQHIYGAAEILVGAVACWTGLGYPSTSALPGSLAVAGGVYIIVRGIDNGVQGWLKVKSAKRKKAELAEQLRELGDHS